MLDFVRNIFSAHGISHRNFIFEMNVFKVATELGLKENIVSRGTSTNYEENNNQRAHVLSISVTWATYQIDIGINGNALTGTL